MSDGANREPRVLLCPCHYLFDEVTEGSEFAWAFNLGDGIARRLPGSVVVTGSANLVGPRGYQIVELQPAKRKRDLSLRNALAFNWRYYRASARLLREKRFDIVHHVLPFALHNTYNLAWLLGRAKGAKLVLGPIQQPLRLQDPSGPSRVPFNAARLASPLASALSRATVLHADRIVVIGAEARDMVLQLGASASRVEVIPPGINLTRYPFVPGSARPSDGIVLLVIGHLTQRKGVDMTVRALAMVVQSHPNVKLKVIGEGPEKAALRQLTHSLGVSENVEFVGHVPNSEIGRYYRASHFLISMSRSESFGAVCLEAMASGLVVIATRVGIFADAIKDGINGFTVEHDDYQSVARKLVSLIDDRTRRDLIGVAARRECENRFDWETVLIPKYTKLYEQVLSE